jgi:hypothetical protein
MIAARKPERREDRADSASDAKDGHALIGDFRSVHGFLSPGVRVRGSIITL